jgi:multiple sugar transport system ATP-binding protein
MAQVIVKNISKVYPGGIKAVNDVSLEVNDKEFVVLVGPSGCGKSTILRLMAGLEEPTGGEIHIGGRLVNDVAPKDRDVAMVFQNYALYPHMTVYDNMAFGLKVRGYGKSEIRERVNEAADLLDIGRLLDRKPKALSGGERQRVAVGRAIVRKPKVFLFDEPLSNLDAKLRVAMRAELIKLHQRLQTAMVYVTHDQVEAMTMGDRIAVLKSGIIQQMADPLTLYDRPANQFVAGFLGTPPMNFMCGKIAGQGKARAFAAATFQVAAPSDAPLAAYEGRDAVLGVRPEDISCDGDTGHTRMKVEVVEPMGAETWVYLTTGEQTIIARLPHTLTRSQLRPGQEVNVTFEMAKAHFFDPETEKAVV